MLDLIEMDEFTAKASAGCILKAINDAGLSRAFWIGDESDNCSTMRGCNQGVTVRLRQEEGLGHLIDLGGCTLHVVHNANKHATEQHFKFIVDFVEDCFKLLKKSNKKSKLFRKIQQEMDFEQHKLLRHVEVRWLCLLPCLERLDEQYETLCLLAAEFKKQLATLTDRQKRVASMLQQPTTRVSIRFLIHVMKLSSAFERWFQQAESILIHLLRPQLLNLLEQIFVQFVKADVLKEYNTKNVHRLPIEVNNCRSTSDILIGSETIFLLKKLPEGSQQQFLLDVRSTYIRLATYLQKNLPLDNACLKSVQFLNLSADVEVNESFVVYLAKRLPRVVPESHINALQSEVRLLNLLPGRPTSSSEVSTAAAWHQIRQLETENGEQKFPLLARISLAASTLFHGNADIERVFGKMHDIDQDDKRNRMADETRRALLLVKSYMASNKITASSVQIDSKLLELGFQARSEFTKYKEKAAKEELQRLKEEEAKAEEARMRELIKQDKERRDHLSALKEKERQHDEQLKDAQRLRLEAEAELQKAIAALTSASDKEKTLVKEKQTFATQKSAIELKAVDKALKVASKEKVQLKRQLSALPIASFTIPRKKKKTDEKF